MYCIQGTYGGLSCDITANHVKECYLPASIKGWSHSEVFPLAFTITASVSLGKGIFEIKWTVSVSLISTCRYIGLYISGFLGTY